MTMIRLPAFSEIHDLFWPHASVDAAVSGVTRAVTRLQEVERSFLRKADRAAEDVARHLAAYADAVEAHTAHSREAARAARVQGRLSNLVH